jgi:hypothetical protein
MVVLPARTTPEIEEPIQWTSTAAAFRVQRLSRAISDLPCRLQTMRRVAKDGHCLSGNDGNLPLGGGRRLIPG